MMMTRLTVERIQYISLFFILSYLFPFCGYGYASDSISTTRKYPVIPPISVVHVPVLETDLGSLRHCALSIPGDKNLFTVGAEMIVSFAYVNSDYDYILFVQDNSGGMLVCDRGNTVLHANYNIGDRIKGLTGYLVQIGGELMLYPTVEPLIISTDNPVYPPNVTIYDLQANPSDYESMLVCIRNAQIGYGENTFAGNKDYPVSQGSATITLFTQFTRADYLGTAIPTEQIDLKAIVTIDAAKGTVLTPRLLSDMVYPMGAGRGDMDIDNIYASDGYINVQTSTRVLVSVFNLMGDLIMQEWADPGQREFQIITPGVYIVRAGEITKRVAIQ